MLALFPGGTRIAAGVLELDGMPATDLAERFGTPLVVYAEDALRDSGADVPACGSGRARRLRDEGVPERRADAPARRGGARRGRLDAGRARVRTAGGHRGRAPARAREQQVGRGAARGRRGRRARRPRRARTSPAGLPPPACAASRPRHAGSRGGDARVDPHRAPRLQVRARRGRRGRGRPRRARRRPRRRGPARPRRLAARGRARAPARGVAARPVRRALPDASSTGCRARSTSAAASGSGTSRRSRSRRSRSSCARSRPRSRASG